MIDFFTRHPTAGNLLMFFLALLGLSQLPQLQRETFPDFASETIQITVPYPGASAEEVEEAICLRLEDAIDSINDVEEIRCEAKESIAQAVIELEQGGDMPRFLDDVKTEVEAIDNFPEQSDRAIIKERNRTGNVVALAITGSMSDSHLKAYAEVIKEKLKRLPEVSQVQVNGFSDHQLSIEVSSHRLRQYGLSISDIANTIAKQGIDLPSGSLESRDREWLLRFTDQRRTPEELADLTVVSANSGSEIRLGQLAHIQDHFELAEEKVLFNGQRAALLQISKTKQQDTLIIKQAVKKFVDEQLRPTAPPGVAFVLTRDRSSIVKDRLSLLLRNGGQGLILVFLTMWLFFQGRFAFWVAMGLPISFLGALFLMGMFGLTINMITMVALLIAIGLLMDDAIVIAENIATRLRHGSDPYTAATEGTRQVAPGVISSFLTTASVFGPLAFLSGHMGKVLQFIPMVLLLVLAVSLIEAFMILPHHLAHSMEKNQRKQSAFRQAFDRRLVQFRDFTVGRLVDSAIHHRYWFMGIVIALFLISIGTLVGGKLKFQSFPDIEGDIIEARLLLPQGTPLRQTEAVVERITQAAQQMNEHFTALQPNQQSLIRNSQVRFNSNADAGESGPHLATVTLDLLTAEERIGHLDDFLHYWRAEVGDVPGIVALNFKDPVLGPGGIPLELRLFGGDLDELKQASLKLQNWLSGYRGVFDISDNLRPGKPELRMRLRDGALALGLDATRIAQQLRSAFHGSTAKEIQVGTESLEINVRLDDSDRASLADLESFRITTSQGEQIPLNALVHIEQAQGYSRIVRIDGIRTVTVSGDLDARVANAQEVVRHTKSEFLAQLKKQHPSVTVRIKGQSAETAKTGSSMLRSFTIGLLGVFILLSFQFRSYSEPLIVMAIIPLSLIGVLWGHIMMGLHFTMPSIIGFTSLAGIVVNDSILLVTFLKLRIAEGQSTVSAAKLASRDRFRAVLLTSITTIAGLIPLLLEKSLQAQILIPLATSIVFGLLTTTILVLFVVPVLFSIMADFSNKYD